MKFLNKITSGLGMAIFYGWLLAMISIAAFAVMLIIGPGFIVMGVLAAVGVSFFINNI